MARTIIYGGRGKAPRLLAGATGGHGFHGTRVQPVVAGLADQQSLNFNLLTVHRICLHAGKIQQVKGMGSERFGPDRLQFRIGGIVWIPRPDGLRRLRYDPGFVRSLRKATHHFDEREIRHRCGAVFALHADGTNRIRRQFLLAVGKIVHLQNIRDDVEINRVAQARRRVSRHSLPDDAEETVQTVFAPLLHEPVADQDAVIPGKIVPVASRALVRVRTGASRRLSFGVNALPDGRSRGWCGHGARGSAQECDQD